LLLLLQALPAAAPLLEYRRALLLHEPWRLITGHLVHLNWTHAFVNAAAWLLLARLFAPVIDARQQLLCVVVGAIVISAMLAFAYPAVAWYRGASGALHALFFAGAAATLSRASRRPHRRAQLLWATALILGGAIKVALELPPGAATPYARWLGANTVPQAHLIGAVAGAGLGLLFGLRRRKEPSVNG
jgi:rhomboid family GlyGly-CTERM serine protease